MNMGMENRLRHWREKRGYSRKKLAELAGTGESVIVKLERGERSLSESWRRRLGPLLGVAPSDLVSLDDEAGGPNTFKIPASEIRGSKKASDADPIEFPVAALPVLGDVQAGVWLEDAIADQDYEDCESIPIIPLPAFSRFRQFALRVRGESMNKIVKDGEYVICADVSAIKSPAHGDILVIVRTRFGGLMRETTLKQVEIKNGRIELWPRSTDEKYQAPILFPEPDEADVTVEIGGLVIGRYASLR